MAGLLKDVIAAYEEHNVPAIAEQYVEDVMERLEDKRRITMSTRMMDSQVRDAVKAGLIGKGCTVEWNGRQLKVEWPKEKDDERTDV